MASWKGTPNFLDQVKAKELVLTDNVSATKGVTFGDSTRQTTAGLAASDIQYALQTIEVPFTYLTIGSTTYREYFSGYDAYTGGYYRVQYWNGSSWTDMGLAISGNSNANGPMMWGLDSEHIWVVNLPGAATAYWNGSTWTNYAQPAYFDTGGYTEGYNCKGRVHGTAVDNVWFPGQQTTGTNAVYKWNGSGWTAMGSAVITEPIKGVHVRTPTDIWAYSTNGSNVYRYNGSTWSAVPIGVGPYRWGGAYAANASHLMLIREGPNAGMGPFSQIYLWNGSSFSNITPADMGYWSQAYNLLGFGTNNIWAIGDYRWQWNGSTWTARGALSAGATHADAASSTNFNFCNGSHLAIDYGYYNGSSWLTRSVGSLAGQGRVLFTTGPALSAISSTTTAPTGSRILRAHVVVDTPFVGTTKLTATIGGTLTVFSPDDSDLTGTLGTQFTKTNITNITAGGAVQVSGTGASSAGAGRVIVEYLVPRL